MLRSGWTLGRGFASLGRYATPCWSPDDPPAPAPAGGTPPPQRQQPEPFAVFPDKESFEKRLERDTRAYLKEKYGLKDEKELDERLERAKKLEEAEQARIKAQQTTEERLKSEKEEADRRAATARAEADAAMQQALVTGKCAQLGIKNVEYALYEANRAGKKTPEELDGFFAEQMKDEAKKSAYGIATPPPAVVPVGGNTAPVPPGGTPPPPPPPGGEPPPTKDVMKMTGPEFQRHLETIGAKP